MATFNKASQNETHGYGLNGEIETTSIHTSYVGGTDRVSEIRVDDCEYHFFDGDHFFVSYAALSGNCGKFGGIGIKKIRSSECQTREEANAQVWKKVNNWLKKNEGFEAEVE